MLSDKQIIQAMELGRIVIDPFKLENLGPNGYDVTLDTPLWAISPDNVGNVVDFRDHTIYKVSLDDGLERFILGIEDLYLPLRNDIYNQLIKIYPHEMVLGTTVERIGCPKVADQNGMVAFFRTRSSLARLGLPFDLTGLGDAGFAAKWTLEILNTTGNTFIIPKGYRVGQIVFFETGEVENWYEGRYNQVEDWSPETMLPRMFVK